MPRPLPVLAILFTTAVVLGGCVGASATSPSTPTSSSGVKSSAGRSTGSTASTVTVPIGQRRADLGGLVVVLHASSGSPVPAPRPLPGTRWLAVEALATNSTNATIELMPPRRMGSTLIGAREVRIVPYASGLDATGVVNFHGEVDTALVSPQPGVRVPGSASVASSPPPPGPPSLRPGGTVRVTGWYRVKIHAGPFSWNWTPGPGRAVTFHLQ